MAKRAKCDRCKVRWVIEVKDQTPLRLLACPRCRGPVSPIYSPCSYRLIDGEPSLRDFKLEDKGRDG